MSSRYVIGLFVLFLTMGWVVAAPTPAGARGKPGIKARVVRAYNKVKHRRALARDFKQLLKRNPQARKTYKAAKKTEGLGTARVVRGVTAATTVGMVMISAAHLANGGSPSELLPLAGPTLASGFGAKVGSSMVRDAKRAARVTTVMDTIKGGNGHLVSSSLKREARGYLARQVKEQKSQVRGDHRDVASSRAALEQSRANMRQLKSQLTLVGQGL